MSRSIVVGRRSYGALHNVMTATVGGGSRVIRSLCSEVLNHASMRSVCGPLANTLVLPTGRRVARSVTRRVSTLPVRRIRVHSMLAYRSGGNMYTGYCKHGPTAKHVIRGNRIMNIVTTRSVNRPNARLALHAFRINNATSDVTSRGRVVTGCRNHLRFSRLHAVSGRRRNKAIRIIVNHATRVHVISTAANVALSRRGVPCNTGLCGGSKSAIRGNAHVYS